MRITANKFERIYYTADIFLHSRQDFLLHVRRLYLICYCSGFSVDDFDPPEFLLPSYTFVMDGSSCKGSLPSPGSLSFRSVSNKGSLMSFAPTLLRLILEGS